MSISSDEFFASLRVSPEIPHGRKWTEEAGAIGAGIAESDFGTADFIKQQLLRAVREGLLTYLPDELSEASRAACRDLYRNRFAWEPQLEWIRETPDVLSGMHVALELFPEDTPVVVPTPSYSPFLEVPASTSRRIVQVPMIHGFDLQQISDALGTPGSVLVLCNPHNPTGEVLNRSQLTALTSVVEEKNCWLFVDEIHAPLVYKGKNHIPFASVSEIARERSITAISPSKGWNIPGLKAAHMIIPNNSLRQKWDMINRFPVRSGSPLGAIGVTAAYSAEGLRWLDALLEKLDSNRRLLTDYIREFLPRVDFREPEATYLAWIGFEAYTLEQAPAQHLLQRAGVATVHGGSCGLGFEQYIRFNFATSPDILTRAMHEITASLPTPALA